MSDTMAGTQKVHALHGGGQGGHVMMVCFVEVNMAPSELQWENSREQAIVVARYIFLCLLYRVDALL